MHLTERELIDQERTLIRTRQRENESYINYILLKVVAALQMKPVILHATATTSRLATPAAVKDGLLRVSSIIYAIRRHTGNQSFVSQSGSPRGYIVYHLRCRWSGSRGVVSFSYRGLVLSQGVVFGGDCELVCGASRLPFWWLRFVFVLLLSRTFLFKVLVVFHRLLLGRLLGYLV